MLQWYDIHTKLRKVSPTIAIFRRQGYKNHINVGEKKGITIRELSETLGKVVGYTCKIEFDSPERDDAPQMLSQRERLGHVAWKRQIPFLECLEAAYHDFVPEYRQQQL